jgi:hypothetical protein
MQTMTHKNIKKTKRTTKRNQSQNNKSTQKGANTTNKVKKQLQNQKVVMVEKTKVEYLLLFNILLNYYILLVTYNHSNNERKQRLEELILQMRHNNKFISRDTSNIQIKNIVNYIDTFFNQLLLLINQSLETKSKQKSKPSKPSKHKGGFYFKSLEEKGEQPITGADLTKLLDEMQQFFYNAKYTEEGKFLQDTDTLLSMLRGDINQFKGILQYRIFPQFYSAYPPFIKWDAIYNEIIEKRRWEDLPDYLLAYQSYLRSRDEYLVDKGLKPPSILQRDLYTGFYNKMANSINDNMYAFQQARNKFQGRFFPITLPP